jgi:hypothetical protein
MKYVLAALLSCVMLFGTGFALGANGDWLQRRRERINPNPPYQYDYRIGPNGRYYHYNDGDRDYFLFRGPILGIPWFYYDKQNPEKK